MDGWFIAMSNWNEHERVVELPVHQDDVNAGMVIPQYEIVSVENGHIRPIYRDPNAVGIILSLTHVPAWGTPRKVAGFLIDRPYDEDGVLKRRRKLCIIRNGRVILPAIAEAPNEDWSLVRGRAIFFVIGRYLLAGVRRVVAVLSVRTGTGHPDEADAIFGSRAGICKEVKIRCFYVGGRYRWIHQAKCYLHPSFLLGWEVS